MFALSDKRRSSSSQPLGQAQIATATGQVSGTPVEVPNGMNRHWKGVMVLALLPILGFVLAGLLHTPMIAVMGVLGTLVAAFVLITAWTRPQHPTEKANPPAPEDRFRAMRQPP